MVAYLIAEEGPLTGLVIKLDEGVEWTLGRDPLVSNPPLEDPMVSRRHARITLHEGSYRAENLSSVNPALLNGVALSESLPLHEDDTLQIGNTLFRFTERAALTAEEEPSAYDATQASLDNLSFISTVNTRWILKVLSGPHVGAEFPLQSDTTYIMGKDTEHCDIVFHDMSVSNQHAKLYLEGDHLFIEDLGSRNGVAVNQRLITGATELQSQDMIALGTTTFICLDKMAPRETIYSPPTLTAEPEAVLAEEKAKSWKEMVIPTRHLIIAAATVLVLLGAIGGFFSLFRTEHIHVAKIDESKEITKTLSSFPGVQFTFEPSTGKLFLIGNVSTRVNQQEMLYLLGALPYISSIEDTVTVDEIVWSDMNALLSRNANWRGVSMVAREPGRFVLRGYLSSQEELMSLNEYLNLNFPYMDKLDNQVVVENTLQTQIQSLLMDKGFVNVTLQLSGGEVILAGRVNDKQEEPFNELMQELKKIRGVREVKNFVVMTTASTARVDLTSRYRITGVSKYGNENQFILIDGKILSQGEQLDGMKITAINQNEVLLEKDGLKYKINYNLQ